ncbi:MAG: T9SS type A sorting domain-containing protein [Bacteroidales bacterium]|nr:T9SS type A sorting domain-containing protein [Bacteroidales bacterium]
MKKILIFILIITACSSTYSQKIVREVMTSAGDMIRFDDKCFSYTLGETINETFHGSNGSFLMQGFQQSLMSLKNNHQEKNTKTENVLISDKFEITVFPNPASDFLYINNKSGSESICVVELYNTQGVKLIRGKYINSKTRLSLTNIPNGFYFLRIISKENNSIDIFKIQIIK